MKLMRDGLIAGLSLAMLAVFSPLSLGATISAGAADGTPHLLTELTFNSTTSTTTSISSTALNSSGWRFGVNNGGLISVQSTLAPGATGASVNALEGSYPVPYNSGGAYVWAHYNVATLHTEDIYIEFWAKMPGVKEGCKFLKVFGERITPTNYANTTIYTNYNGGDYGAVTQVAFGDGTTEANDTQNAINLNGRNPQAIGRSYGQATVQTPQMSNFSSSDWGTTWHHFKIHIKFNSGTTAQNEVPNGEYYLEIDGKVYVNATGLYNRNPTNGPINFIGFFGWAQTESQPFQLWYDDIRISTGGFITQPLPDPPSNVGVQ